MSFAARQAMAMAGPLVLPHTCVGIHLAKLEMAALLRAMVPRVRAITVGEPQRMINNTLAGFTAFPARFEA